MLSGKTIFISPLDWGLGHATRCVPIIRQLQPANKIIIGVTSLTKQIFETEFPDLKKVEVPSYNIRYSLLLPLWLKLLTEWPRFNSIIKEERELLEKIIHEHKVDTVISDSRFGLHSKKTHNIFITHQLFLKAPFANAIAQKKNKKFILSFNEVWVPDFENETNSLSGELSHGNHYHPNVKYIGLQSRLLKVAEPQKKYDCLFLLSGPEPQRTVLKNKLIQLAKRSPSMRFAITNNGPVNTGPSPGNIDFYTSPSAQELSSLICSSNTVICRSGYSSLMDLFMLEKKKLILVPTPGQTEQEYLASYWQKKFGAITITQNKIDTFNF